MIHPPQQQCYSYICNILIYWSHVFNFLAYEDIWKENYEVKKQMFESFVRSCLLFLISLLRWCLAACVSVLMFIGILRNEEYYDIWTWAGCTTVNFLGSIFFLRVLIEQYCFSMFDKSVKKKFFWVPHLIDALTNRGNLELPLFLPFAWTPLNPN